MTDKAPKTQSYKMRRAGWVGAKWCKADEIVELAPAQAKYVPADPVAPAAKAKPKPAKTSSKPAAPEADDA